MPQAAFLLLTLLFLPFFGHAAEILQYNGEQAVKPYLEYWVPPSSTTTLTAAQVAEQAAREPIFQAVEGLTLPAQRRDVWYRLRLEIDRQGPELVLNFSEILFDEIDLYVSQGPDWIKKRAGKNVQRDDNYANYRLVAFLLDKPAADQSVTDVYFRVKGNRHVIINPHLQSAQEFFATSIAQTNISTFLIGSLLAMLIYIAANVRIFFSKGAALIFIGFITAVLINVAYYDGYILPSLKGLPISENGFHTLVTGVLSLCSLLFCQVIFNLKETVLWLNRSITVFVVAHATLIIIIASQDNISLAGLDRFFGFFTLVLLFITGITALVKRIPSALFFAAAIFSYLLNVVYTILASQNILFSFDLYSRAYTYMGTVLLALFSTLALQQKIRQLKQQEKQLSSAAATAEAENAAKTQFLATMSHEIRTPVNGMLGMAQLLKLSPLNAAQKKLTDTLLYSGDQLQKIIDNILDFSKAESGQIKLEQAPFNLDKILALTVRTFSQIYSNKPVKLMFDYEPDTPLFLLGDSNRLQQVLNNLLSNAFKFTDQGEIKLYVSAESLTEQDVCLRFQITDSGIGISEEQQQHLFQAYTQADSSTTRRFGGTGLGLTISKQLVELMGGKISVDSQPGQGSCFTFTAQFTLDRQQAEEFAKQCAELRTLKILLLSDSDNYLQYIASSLEQWGITVAQQDATVDTSHGDKPPHDILITSANNNRQLSTWAERCAQWQLPLVITDCYQHIMDNDLKLNITDTHLHYLSQPAGKQDLFQIIHHIYQHTGDNKSLPGERSELPDFSHLRVLVAEDNLVNIQVVQGILGKLGIQPDIALDGHEVIAKYCADKAHYDLIFMDCEMPQLDGFEATKSIRQFERQQQKTACRICALTAHALQDTRQRCFDAGMDHVLIKPLRLQQLTQYLQQMQQTQP